MKIKVNIDDLERNAPGMPTLLSFGLCGTVNNPMPFINGNTLCEVVSYKKINDIEAELTIRDIKTEKDESTINLLSQPYYTPFICPNKKTVLIIKINGNISTEVHLSPEDIIGLELSVKEKND
jgi:hypothetical protein